MLSELSRAKRLAFYHRYTDRTLPVLFESKQEGLWTGLTDNYIRVGVVAPADLTNQMRDVFVTGVMDGLALGDLRSLEGAPVAILEQRVPGPRIQGKNLSLPITTGTDHADRNSFTHAGYGLHDTRS